MYRKPTFASNLIRHLVIWLVLVFALFPVIWIISGSFNPANTLVGQKLIPEQPSWVNYRALINSPQHPFPLWMWNSIKVALITSILAVAMTSLAAYASVDSGLSAAPGNGGNLLAFSGSSKNIPCLWLKYSSGLNYYLFGGSNRCQYLADEGLY